MKRALVSIVGLLILAAGAAYHLIFGSIDVINVSEGLKILHRTNLLGQIGANVVVHLTPSETTVVDTQLKPLASSTRTAVEALASTPITRVYVTHWHPDHSGGIATYSEDTKVFAHANVARILSAEQEGFGLTAPDSRHSFTARPEAGKPNQLIEDHLSFDEHPMSLSVQHYPQAHTDGDLVIFFQGEQVAVLGDLVWPGSFPFVDVHNGGTVAGLENALEKIIRRAKPPYRFITGHGEELLDYGQLTQYLGMIRATRTWVESALDEGRTPEDLKAEGLPTKWSAWSSDLVPSTAWIDAIARSR